MNRVRGPCQQTVPKKAKLMSDRLTPIINDVTGLRLKWDNRHTSVIVKKICGFGHDIRNRHPFRNKISAVDFKSWRFAEWMKF